MGEVVSVNQSREDIAWLITSCDTSDVCSIFAIEDIIAMVRPSYHIFRGLYHRDVYTSCGFLSDSRQSMGSKHLLAPQLNIAEGGAEKMET